MHLKKYGILTAIVLLFCGIFFLLKYHTKSTPISSFSVSKESIFPKAVFPNYQQTNPKWANQKIGGSKEKIANVGCTLCCLSMALYANGYRTTPAKLNNLIKGVNGYTKDGWIIWDSIYKITQGKFRVVIPKNPSHKAIEKNLRQGNPVIAKILLNDSIFHWVLIKAKKGKQYLVNDPLNNNQETYISKFKSPIYAIRYLEQ